MNNVNCNNRKVVWSIWAGLLICTPLAHVVALPPDPNNAALLYYQALALRSDSIRPHVDASTIGKPRDDIEMIDVTITPKLDKMLALSDKIEDEYLKKRRESMSLQIQRERINLVEAASRIPRCVWGIRYSQGCRLPVGLTGQLRNLGLLLNEDARTFAADGKYREAFGRCLSLRRFARHLGDEYMQMYLLSLAVDGVALRCIQNILESMPPDANTLTWLQGQLTSVQGAPPSLVRVLKTNTQLALQAVRRNPKLLMPEKVFFSAKPKDRSVKKEAMSLTDEGLVARTAETYSRFIDSILGEIISDKPYTEKYTELERLKEKLREQEKLDPALSQLSLFAGDSIPKCYSLRIALTSKLNALKIAIEIYLAIAKTGQLPETLPDYMPKDPYSGQDFEYEITEEGFVLRCRVKAIGARKVQQYEFKVQK